MFYIYIYIVILQTLLSKAINQATSNRDLKINTTLHKK